MTEEEAVKHFENMVHFYAIRFSGAFEKEDLAAEGFIGVIHACRTYDPERHDNFVVHVRAHIQNAMLKSMRYGRSGFHIPHRTEATKRKIYRLELEHETPEAIAEKLGIDVREARRGLFAASRGRVHSLDRAAVVDGEEGASYSDIAGVRDDTSHLYVRDFLSTLSDRDRLILRRTADGVTQKQIAAELGVSQMSISRYLRQIGERYEEEYA